MQPVLVTDDPRFVRHLEKMPHMESSRRIKAAREVIEDERLQGRLLAIPPRLASVEELAMVHTRDYIRKVAASAGKPLTTFDMDTQATEKSYNVARLGAGAVFSLIDAIYQKASERAFAFIRPPGHHAEPDRAMGFCLFNNIALGARYLQKKYGVKRILITDIDAHHGNGTQRAFYDTKDILYFSIHQFPAYPGSGNVGEVGEGDGEGYTINVPLGNGYRDRDFGRILYFLLAPVAREFKPEIILVSCGFDLYLNDRLCKMRVTPEGYALITFFLLDMAQRLCNGRILFAMEGGYSLRGIRECAFRTIQEMCDMPTVSAKAIRQVTEADPAKLAFLQKVFEVQKKYWTSLRRFL